MAPTRYRKDETVKNILSRCKWIIEHAGPNRHRRRMDAKDEPGRAKMKPRNWKRKKKARRKMAQASRKRNR